MHTRVARLIAFLASFSIASAAAAQGARDLSPTPMATAENEDWYLSASPISFGGAIYHSSGPVIHFMRNEMIPAGMFERIQLYRRTTQEPGSVIYVPLPGGLMRPYERRRAGDLAGTVGSSVPAFPVVLPAEEGNTTTSGPPAFAAPAVPRAVGTSGYAYGAIDRAIGTAVATPIGPASADTGHAAPVPVSTTGTALLTARSRPLPTRVETVQRPTGLNSVFLQFQDARWFAAGPAVEFDASRFTKVGEHLGFPVYQEPGRSDTIFVPPLGGTPGLVTPYKVR